MSNLLTFILWLLLLIYLNIVPPDTTLSLIGFFILLFSAVFGSTRVFTHRFKRNILLTSFLLTLALLAYFHLFNPLNLILAAALFSLLDTF